MLYSLQTVQKMSLVYTWSVPFCDFSLLLAYAPSPSPSGELAAWAQVGKHLGEDKAWGCVLRALQKPTVGTLVKGGDDFFLL